MARYVALLRGINVGKAKRVSMADLRALLEELGHTDVATVLMSGNVVFTSSSRSAPALSKAIEGAIASKLSMDVRVFVRSVSAVAAIADDVPWPSLAKQDPSRLQISFHDGAVDRSALAAILSADWSPERFAVGKGATYAWHPDGVTGSKLAEALLKVKGGAVGTVRNLATVRKILDRAGSSS
jgi:uncharacterized protein (DUF1697 family)